MYISERSRGRVYPLRRISDSKNEMAEKHQHVLELLWFFTEVMGFSFTVSKI